MGEGAGGVGAGEGGAGGDSTVANTVVMNAPTRTRAFSSGSHCLLRYIIGINTSMGD